MVAWGHPRVAGSRDCPQISAAGCRSLVHGQRCCEACLLRPVVLGCPVAGILGCLIRGCPIPGIPGYPILGILGA